MPGVSTKEIAKLEAKQAAQQSGSALVSTEPVPLSTMFGQGVRVSIGAAEYEVSPIPLRRLAEGGEMIRKCPDILVTHALVASLNGGQYDAKATAEFLRSQVDGEAATPITDAAIGTALAMGVYSLPEENVQAMIDLTILVLQRKHKNLTAADIEDDLDVPIFLDVLRGLYTLDPHLRERFEQPGREAGG